MFSVIFQLVDHLGFYVFNLLGTAGWEGTSGWAGTAGWAGTSGWFSGTAGW